VGVRGVSVRRTLDPVTSGYGVMGGGVMLGRIMARGDDFMVAGGIDGLFPYGLCGRSK
jgi:lipid-A-disaccharide synthase-like uncharacterized protein